MSWLIGLFIFLTSNIFHTRGKSLKLNHIIFRFDKEFPFHKSSQTLEWHIRYLLLAIFQSRLESKLMAIH